ncbi:hypothetical protein OESDEN_03830 [Oesophagostomum dentatum]|uniref:Uncharacterized protein n=1 Tax=Oesophagostomum dentatum TaxID=61180 RepID=A0A0B1TLE4_OESDE|nr:hypothetical protein OESDEN_03830 [Oesophagostomum dentatum]
MCRFMFIMVCSLYSLWFMFITLQVVTTGRDENAMDKYIRDDGSVETGQFLSILRRQLEESRKQQISLADDLRTEREHLKSSKKKENELKKFIKVRYVLCHVSCFMFYAMFLFCNLPTFSYMLWF